MKPQQGNNNMGVILAVILVLGGAYVYRSFFLTPIDPAATTADITTAGAGKNVVDIYQSLQAANLDTNFFAMPSYRSLQDLSAPVRTESVGRRNPFDKI